MILGGTAGVLLGKYLAGSALKSFSSFYPENLKRLPCTPASNSSLPFISHPFFNETGQYYPQKPIGIGSLSSVLSAHTRLMASSSVFR